MHITFGLTFTQYYVISILILSTILLLLRVIRHDIVGLLTIVLLTIGGVVPVNNALSFFGSTAIIVLASIMVISKVLEESGFIDRLADDSTRYLKNSIILILVILTIVSFTSGFVSDVALTAIFIPYMYVVSRNLKKRISKFMIPLSYAAIVGGRYTIFGTSTNLFIDQLWFEKFNEYLSVFQFIKVGIAIIAVSIPTLLLIYLIMPSRENIVTSIEDLKVGGYIIEAEVDDQCEWVGKTRSYIEKNYNVKIRAILPRRMARRRVITSGMTLVLEVPVEKIPSLTSIGGLKITPIEESKQTGELTEVLVPNGSRLIGSNISSEYVMSRYGVSVIGISSSGRRIYGRISHMTIKPGDALLLMGNEDSVSRFMSDYGLLPLGAKGARIFNVRKGMAALVALIAATVLSLIGFNTALSFMLATVALIISGAANYRRIYQYIEWPILVFMVGYLSLGYAIESSGLSSLIFNLIRGNPVALFLLTSLLANFINNMAAAAIMGPVALSFRNPLEALTIVAMASSSTFLTPYSHPANLLVYNIGSYKVKDYLIAGSIMLAVVMIVSLIIIKAA
ncbi:MAG: SLC13 family permease [Caldivirga sp.]|uniref:SLC13 family permease n=2 Tax=Caldivirga sp. TaxID=2080243 RepID=UPI003D1210B4